MYLPYFELVPYLIINLILDALEHVGSLCMYQCVFIILCDWLILDHFWFVWQLAWLVEYVWNKKCRSAYYFVYMGSKEGTSSQYDKSMVYFNLKLDFKIYNRIGVGDIGINYCLPLHLLATKQLHECI